jgi:hypothetical protein
MLGKIPTDIEKGLRLGIAFDPLSNERKFLANSVAVFQLVNLSTNTLKRVLSFRESTLDIYALNPHFLQRLTACQAEGAYG